MAFTRVNPGDPIQAHQLDQVIDALNGVAGAGQPVALTALNDATNYALTVQNDEATNSRALNVLKSDGTTLIKADVTGVTLGAPLNLPSGSITSTYIADGTIQNVDLGPDVARANLLTNGGFEIWQRGNGPFSMIGTTFAADRWSSFVQSGDSASVSRDTTNIDTGSGACMAVTFTRGGSSPTSGIVQIVSFADEPGLSGRPVALSVRVRTSTPNAAKLGLYSGSGPTWAFSSYHPGDGAYHTLTLSTTMAVLTAGNAYVAVFFDATCTAYVDNACLVIGSQPANYVPLHPADDLARCLRYYEIIGETPNEVLVIGYQNTGTQDSRFYPFKARKPVAPTVTKVGTWNVTNCSQPAVGSSGVTGLSLNATVTALGAFNYNNNVVGACITVEANP